MENVHTIVWQIYSGQHMRISRVLWTMWQKIWYVFFGSQCILCTRSVWP